MATITMYHDINVDDAFSPLFSAVGYGVTSAASTADPTSTWSARTLPSASNWNSVVYGNKLLVAVSGSTTVGASSPDGITWTARTLPASAIWQSVTFGSYNSGTFVAVANGSTNSGYSTNGITWTLGGALPSSAAWFCLAYGEGTYVAVSTTNSTAAASSIDGGVNWVARTLPAAKNWQSVCYGNGVFIAVSYGTTDVAYSADGLTWTAAGAMPTARNWSSVTWGNPGNTANGIFVAVAYGTAVGAISTDNGTSWTEVDLAPDMVVNGSFTGNADFWTLGAGWTYGTNKVTHTGGGGTATLTPNPALTIVASTFYQVKFTVSGCTAGSVTMNIGGTNGTSRSADGTYTEVITTASTANLIFTPTTDFDGAIDDVVVRYVANWNCISYGESSAQGVKVFTVTAYGQGFNTVSFDGTNWFIKTMISATNWKYHCYAPITWNSGDTLVVNNNAIITVSTDQTKFWKTITGTYGTLKIINTSTSTALGFYMGRVTSTTANDITPSSGAFSIDIDGNWIEIGTGSGGASQTMTAPYTEYIPSLWVETGSGTGVYEVWNNVTGAYGPYMAMFGRDGLEWVGSGKRGNYFVQTPSSNPIEIISLASGATTTGSYLVTCTSTTGVLPGARVTGTGIGTNAVVNRVVSSTTLELSVVSTANGSGLTLTVYNPRQAQFTSTVVFGDGTSGNVVPSGAKVRLPNLMISDLTAASLIGASYLLDALINMSNGGFIDARICLFGAVYVNLLQSAAVYLRNCGFVYQWALAECYDVDMDGIGCSASPTTWYYGTKWIARDNRYGVFAPIGYTTPVGSNNVAISYIHNASIKNWHKVTYCTAWFTGTAVTMPVDLADTEDAVFENIRLVTLNATRLIRSLNISGRVNRTSFTNLELYGAAPLLLSTSNSNTFTGIEYAIDLKRPIKAFKTAMRLYEHADGTPFASDVPLYIKTRTFYAWNTRTIYFDSGEYSATPFQNNWLFPDTLSIRPTESVPASVTFNWTQREPSSATTLAYEIFRSTSAGFTTRDTTTSVFRVATPATVTFVNSPRTTIVASASPTLTFNVAKTITASVATFVTAGYAVGDVVEVTGTTANNGTYTINTLTSTVMTVNETLVTETAYSSLATITGKAPVVDTKYYYRMRKFHSSTAHVDCSVASGSATLTTSAVNPSWGFDRLYALTEFYYDSGSTVLRTRKTNLFATPFYKGATITGTNIPAGTTILNIDAAGREMVISQATTGSATNATVILPVQAGMAVTWQISKPGAGLPYGTTVASVESATSLTLSQNVTADIGYVTNGSFTGSATGWTLNAGWAYGTNNVSHTSGTATMTQTSMNVVIGGVYTVTYTISGMSAGTVTVSIGGAAGTARSANGTYTQALTATTTGTLTFTPTTTFNGTIDDVYAGVTLNFLPMTESPELVATPHDYTGATNYCLQNRTLATTWVASGVTATNANTYAAPSMIDWATASATRLVSSTSPGTVTQSVTGLTIATVYSASIWVRADQDATNPTGIAGNFSWGTITTPFTATNEWKKVEANNFTATATSHNLVVSITTTGKTIWATDAMVAVGTTTTAPITTTTTPATIKPVAIPITTLYSYSRPQDMTGSIGHQGIHVTFGSAPTGSYYHEVYASTTSGFTPSDTTLVARTWALDDLAPFNIATSQSNNFSDIVKLEGGGSSSTASAGIFALTANSNNNAFVNVDIDYSYCNTTAIPALHLVTPSQNNVFHNVDLGRNANYLALPGLWHSTAANSVTGNRLQNIYADHYDIPLNNQSLSGKIKGLAGGNSYPAATATTFAIGNTIDGIDVAKTAAYGSMFNEHFRGVSANLLPNGSFTGSASGWTLGSGWSYSANAVVHSSGTATLVPNPAVSIVVGHEYEVTYTISGRTTGSVTMSLGGASGTARSTNGVFTEKLTATTTGNLTFTPTTGFDGSLDDINFGESIGALHVVFEDTQGVKPYTVTGSPKFSNTGRLYLATTADTITLTWPHKIKGVTGFRNMIPRLIGLDLGNNNNLLDALKVEYKINTGSFTLLTPANLVAEGTLDAVNGFDLQLKFTPRTFMKFSTQTTGTYTSHTVATPGVITTGATAWATGQVVRYTTTGDPFGGLTADTNYYLIVVSTTTFQLATTEGGAGIALTSAPGSGVHTFNVNFVVGETILGATSFATAVVDEVYYDTVNAGTLILSSVSGSWVAGENIRTADNTATKALNVATNFFALGPQYTSYINALEIMTTTNRSKLYDAAIVTVTLTNIVPNSLYYIYNSTTSALVAQGTATGTPDPGETTINYAVSVVYEANFDITVNVRKSSAPTKYLPYETGATVTSAGASVFIAQVIDTVVLDSYASIAADWTIDVTYETIKHTSGTTSYTVNHLYSYLLDYFDELGYLDDQIPMSASTPTEYNLINGWFIDDESFKYLSGGAITTIGQNAEVYALTLDSVGYTSAVSGDLTKVVTNGGSTHTGRLLAYDNTRRIWWIRKVLSTFTAEAITITSGTGAGTITSVATGESIWSNIFTLGTIVSGTTLDVYQNDVQITPWWSTNHIDILVKVKESGTEVDSGNLTVLARLYGTLYDHFVIDASSGRNPVPLAAFADGNNATAEGTVGAYSGITFDFGYVSKDMGAGGKPYDVVIDAGAHTIQELYEYLKYVTRSSSATTFTGYDSIPGEFYTGVGDVRFDYDTEAVSNFVEGERINANGGTSIYGYVVSLLDNGTSGTLVLRNVHGTLTNNMTLVGVTSGTTALVNGTVTSITPQKQAPFGTFAGGEFYGARGVWIENVATSDANNYHLIDSTGTAQDPPATITVRVNGVVAGDKVSVFRAEDTIGTINRTYMTSHDTANTAGLSTFQVNAIPADTPSAGRIRIRNSAGTTEHNLRYASWTGTTFTLRTAIAGTITAIDDVTGRTFSDTNASLSTVEPGDLIRNTSDGSPGSWAQIITITNTGGDDYTITHTPLQGGTDNQWNVGDNYSIHTLPATYDASFTAYAPYIDETATGTSITKNVTYVANRDVTTQVRRKGIIPFNVNNITLDSTGYTATAVRTTDSIVT